MAQSGPGWGTTSSAPVSWSTSSGSGSSFFGQPQQQQEAGAGASGGGGGASGVGLFGQGSGKPTFSWQSQAKPSSSFGFGSPGSTSFGTARPSQAAKAEPKPSEASAAPPAAKPLPEPANPEEARQRSAWRSEAMSVLSSMEDDGELMGGRLTPASWSEFVKVLPLPEIEDDADFINNQFQTLARQEGRPHVSQQAAVDWYIRYQVERQQDRQVRGPRAEGPNRLARSLTVL